MTDQSNMADGVTGGALDRAFTVHIQDTSSEYWEV